MYFDKYWELENLENIFTSRLLFHRGQLQLISCLVLISCDAAGVFSAPCVLSERGPKPSDKGIFYLLANEQEHTHTYSLLRRRSQKEEIIGLADPQTRAEILMTVMM